MAVTVTRRDGTTLQHAKGTSFNVQADVLSVTRWDGSGYSPIAVYGTGIWASAEVDEK